MLLHRLDFAITNRQASKASENETTNTFSFGCSGLSSLLLILTFVDRDLLAIGKIIEHPQPNPSVLSDGHVETESHPVPHFISS